MTCIVTSSSLVFSAKDQTNKETKLESKHTMSMGCIPANISSNSRKNNVLKLIHPGGFVEIHMKPVKAAEILKKNPRHCVARPDVFRHPEIVVKPESVLKLGRVFYIVPNLTIYHLLQARQASTSHEQRGQPPNNHSDSYSPRRPKPRIEPRGKKNLEHRSPFGGSWVEQQSPVGLQANTRFTYQSHNRRSRKKSPIKSCAGGTPKHQDRHRLQRESRVGSWVEVTSMSQDRDQHLSQEYYASSIEMPKTKGSIINDHIVAETRCLKDNAKLKSCLRNPGDKRRRSNSLRVTFLLPRNGEKKPPFKMTSGIPLPRCADCKI